MNSNTSTVDTSNSDRWSPNEMPQSTCPASILVSFALVFEWMEVCAVYDVRGSCLRLGLSEVWSKDARSKDVRMFVRMGWIRLICCWIERDGWDGG
jgi:hypothetical protein